MNWIGTLVAAVCGALAAILLSPVIKRLFKGEATQRWVFLVLFALVLALGREWVSPLAERYYQAHTLEDTLASNQAIAALKTYEPASYVNLISSAKEAVKEGKSKTELAALSSGVIQKMIMKRLPTTSNAAALAYMKVQIDEIRLLHGRQDDVCYAALFPEQAPPMVMSDYITPELREADSSTLAEVLRASALTPERVPTEAQFIQALGNQATVLFTPARLADLQKLAEMPTSVKDRRRACEITISLYDAIFRLPPDLAGLSTRYLIGQSG